MKTGILIIGAGVEGLLAALKLGMRQIMFMKQNRP
jgi:thioredoxin reductase